MHSSTLIENIKSYMLENKLGLREFARLAEISPATMTRILKIGENNNDLALHPKTRDSISRVLGFKFEDLISKKIEQFDLKDKLHSEIITVKGCNQHKVYFTDFDMHQTGEYIYSDEPYNFAIKIVDGKYSPLFPEKSILFFSKENGVYQNDISIIKHKGKYILAQIKSLYRVNSLLVNISNDETFEVKSNEIKFILSFQLNPS